MPHIRIRGLEKNKIAKMARGLVEDVARVSGAPVAHFTLESVSTEFFDHDRIVSGESFCEVLWFDRGQEIQDKAAQLITRHLKEAEPAKDAVVIFTLLKKNAYYENGDHF